MPTAATIRCQFSRTVRLVRKRSRNATTAPPATSHACGCARSGPIVLRSRRGWTLRHSARCLRSHRPRPPRRSRRARPRACGRSRRASCRRRPRTRRGLVVERALGRALGRGAGEAARQPFVDELLPRRLRLRHERHHRAEERRGLIAVAERRHVALQPGVQREAVVGGDDEVARPGVLVGMGQPRIHVGREEDRRPGTSAGAPAARAACRTRRCRGRRSRGLPGGPGSFPARRKRRIRSPMRRR